MQRRSFLTLATVSVASAGALAACGSSGGTGGSYTIGISQYVTHTSLDAARDGFKQALKDAGLDVTYDEQNAQADQATVTSIATKFASDDLDLVLAIATPSAQAVALAVTATPVLFTAVTDPVAAELVTSLDAPGANVTGTTDMNPVADQIGLIKKLRPDATSVGIIYSSGEVNSAVQVKLARETAQKEGLTTQEATITEQLHPYADQLRISPALAASWIGTAAVSLSHPLLTDQQFTDPAVIARLLLDGLHDPAKNLQARQETSGLTCC